MTIEKVIKHFEEQARCNYKPTREAAELAIAALRAQQAPAQLDRSRWGCEWCGFYKSQQQLYLRRIMYCEKCGKPLTEAAWAELEQRIR